MHNLSCLGNGGYKRYINWERKAIMSKIKFEVITEKDVELVREIYLYYVRNSTATFHIREISLEEMKALVTFSEPKYEGYLIKMEDEVCGYVLLTQFKPREAFSHSAEVTIYLKHGYEGTGNGRIAIEFIETRAREPEKEIHTLLALICGENIGSRMLFEKSGYSMCGVYREAGYKFDRWLDLITYQKLIVKE